MVVQTEGQRSNNHKKNSVIKEGNQPEGGQINWKIRRQSLPGYSGCDTIEVIIHFDDGIQSVSLWCALFFTASLRQCFSIKVNRHLFSASLTTLKHLSLSVFLLCGIMSGLFLIHFHGANGDTDRCVLITTEIPCHDSH